MTIAFAAGQTRRMQLRAATRAAHQTLDDLIGAWADRADYSRYLAGQRRFRRAIEAVDPQRAGLDWHFTTLGPAIFADCADLGMAVDETTPPLEEPRDRSAALGLAYVVEGSALGARLLVARAGELGLDASFAARHLVLQAEGGRWRDFVTCLEASEPFDLDVAVAAADGAFASAAAAFGSA